MTPRATRDKQLTLLGVGPFLVVNQLSSLAYERMVQRRQAEERAALEKQLERSRGLQAIGLLVGGVAHDFNNLLTLAARFPGIATLYTSGYTADVMGRHGVLELGVKLLAKPVDRIRLLRAVRRIFGRKITSPRRPRHVRSLLLFRPVAHAGLLVGRNRSLCARAANTTVESLRDG